MLPKHNVIHDIKLYRDDTLLMIGKIIKPWWLIIPFDVLFFDVVVSGWIVIRLT